MAQDVEKLLREAMARHAEEAPVLNDLARRAQSRVQRRRQVLVGLGFAAAVALAVASTRWLDFFDEPDPRTEAPSVESIALPSSGWSAGDGGHHALLTGTLMSADGDCLYASLEAGGSPRGLLWPVDWSAQQSPDGLVVLDNEGAIVLREGDEFQVAGAVRERRNVCGLGEHPVFAMEARPQSR